MQKILLAGSALALVTFAVSSPAFADAAASADQGSTPPAPDNSSIVVTAKRLDDARASIQKSLGADSYAITNATIQALPGGDNQQFNQIILQLPGVVQDGFGQFHVRDDHANLQYRINGTILPEGLAVFGQTLSPRLIDQFALLTGALPAQYGLRTAGIIDIKTKNGFTNGGDISVYGGSNGTIEPSFEYGGSSGSTNYFVSGSYRHDDVGIESVDGSRDPLHDKTDQYQTFAYVDHILSDSDRISVLGGYANQWFQIPNPRGLHPSDGWDVGGVTDFLSDDLNETQLEKTGFGQLSWLHDSGNLTTQTAVFARYSSLAYRPDVLGELLFNGQAQDAFKSDLALGGQFDGSWRVGGGNTIRFGLFAQHDNSKSNTSTQVFPVDGDGNQTGQPITIVDNSTHDAWTLSAYLQDELQITPQLTLNVGGRYDHYKAYRSESQFSPRVNLVWEPTGTTTIHVGYSRYFSPPPFELVASTSIAKFVGTSAEPEVLTDTTPYAERQHYFDAGFQQKIGPDFTFGVDGYYRISRNLIDEGQFGAPIILTPFNYQYGRIKGMNAYFNYKQGPWLLYGNLAYAKAQGKQITSSEFSFSSDDLAYIHNHYIYLDHDQTWTASAGASYAFEDGALKGLRLGSTMIYGSGLRADGDVPNGAKLPPYAQFNLAVSYELAGPGVQLRFDVENLFDHQYEIRDGTGVGVGAPEWGPRRGFFVGISKSI